MRMTWIWLSIFYEGGEMTVSDEEADQERLSAINRLLVGREDIVVIDVGANEGQFTLELLQIGPCTVYCFEPVKAAYEALTRQLGEFPHVHLIPEGIDIHEGSSEMFVTDSTVGSSLLPPLPGQTSKWAQLASTETVQTTRLDTFIDGSDVGYVDLLKVDTLGTDERVLQSAGRHLTPDSIGAILVEFNFHQFYDGQGRTFQILKLLEDSGYFLAEIFKHFNYEGWLWWADALFLPNKPPFSTQTLTQLL